MCRSIEMFPRPRSTNVKYFTYILIQMKKYSVSLKPFANFRIFIWMKNQTAMKQEGTLPSNYSTQTLFNVQAISILNILYACKWRISSTEEKKGKES